jgi:hypothetical protein
MANNKIILKKSSVIGKIPQATDLEYGELAINYADGVLYYKSSANSVLPLSAGDLNDLSDVTITSPTTGQVLKYNGTAWVNDTDDTGTGGTGGSIEWVLKTANYTAVSGDHLLIDTTSGSFTLTLPSSPSVGDFVVLADVADWGTNNLLIARNGSTIETLSEDVTVDIGSISLNLVYDGSTWQIYTSGTPSEKEIPEQTGNSGKYLTTDGTNLSWGTVSATGSGLPNQVGNDGKFLTTDGTDASWADAAVSISDDTTTDSDAYYPTLSTTTSGNLSAIEVSSTKLFYNPSSGKLNATSFNTLSDVRTKKNIQTIDDALNKVSSLRGVYFDWEDSGEKSTGVIAQEIEKILPEVVSTSKDGQKSVAYGNIVGLLIEAIKDLQKDINNLKERD